MVGSLSWFPTMSGGSSFLSEKVLSAPREWGGMTAARAIAVRSFAYDKRLPSAKLGWVEIGGTQ